MKRLSRAVMLMLALFLIIPPEAGAVQLLIPGGQLIGLELYNDAVTVAAFDDTCAAAAREAGLQIGDRILTVDGKAVSSAEDVRQALKSCGSQVTLGLLRGSKELTITYTFADGRTYTVPAGTQIRLTPGESIHVQQYLYHDFEVEPGTGPVLLGEVSQCNDDNTDNRFHPPVGRFPAIEEDEPPYRLLCNEYPAAE